MELPLELKQMIENNAALREQKKLLPAAANISERYRSEHIDGGRAASTAEEIAAYSVVRMPATFGAVSRALMYSAPYCGEIRTVLDAGAGTGAASWAATEVFADVENVVCAEREKEMIKLGSMLMEQGSFPAGYRWEESDLVSGELERADLVTASYVLNELKSAEHPTVIAKLWDAAEKMLVLIEPGTVSGYRNILAARGQLTALGAHIAAPCPHGNDCPLPEGDWCHFTVRVPRSRLHKQLKGADVPYEDEKFCFLAAVREDMGQCASRVLRHPKIESGRVTLTLCTGGGLRTQNVTKKDGALFKKARKADSGDEF